MEQSERRAAEEEVSPRLESNQRVPTLQVGAFPSLATGANGAAPRTRTEQVKRRRSYRPAGFPERAYGIWQRRQDLHLQGALRRRRFSRPLQYYSAHVSMNDE